MLISINNSLVRTSNIYQIDHNIPEECPVINQDKFKWKKGLAKHYWVSGMTFTITVKQFNGNDIVIDKHAKLCDTLEETNESIRECYNKVLPFLDKITKVWSNNQSNIPQFNLE